MDFELRISGHESDKIKLTWAVDRETLWSPYMVGRKTLEAEASRVRRFLDQLASNPFPEADDADLETNTKLFTNLAIAGSALSTALFTPIEGDREIANEVLGLIQGQNTRGTLLVFSDACVQVPWNFVYRGSKPQTYKYDSDPDRAIADFWAAKFSITTRFNKNKFMADAPIPRAQFRAMYAISDREFNCVLPYLTASELEDLNRLLEMQVGRSRNWDECREKWETMKDSDGLLYFFGHSDGAQIELDKEDKESLTNTDFMTSFKKGASKTSTIAFFNGCRTLYGDGDYGFLWPTSESGFQGFVGAEAKVNNVLATKWAIRFLTLVCEQGQTIRQAIDHIQLDRSLFPTSFLYSCYAHPKFRVAPIDSFEPDGFERVG